MHRITRVFPDLASSCVVRACADTQTRGMCKNARKSTVHAVRGLEDAPRATAAVVRGTCGPRVFRPCTGHRSRRRTLGLHGSVERCRHPHMPGKCERAHHHLLHLTGRMGVDRRREVWPVGVLECQLGANVYVWHVGRTGGRRARGRKVWSVHGGHCERVWARTQGIYICPPRTGT